MVVGEFADAVDLLVLGGGPGGYAAAIRAAQLGRAGDARRARGRRPGWAGSASRSAASPARRSSSWPTRRSARATCAPPGSSADGREPSRSSASRPGAASCAPAWRAASASCSTAGDVRVVHGEARFNRADRVAVRTPEDRVVFFEFEHAIVATGSRPVALPGPALRRRARAGLDRRAGADRGPRERRRRRAPATSASSWARRWPSSARA